MTAEKIYKKGLCLGCGICNSITEDVNLDFIEDEKGKYKPISYSFKKIKNLEKICPGIYVDNDKPLRNKNELIWGHYKNIYEGFSTDDEIRFKGSSGGALTAIAVFLLEKKIVDGILHMQESNEPLKYSLTISKTKNELIKSTGSKYIASDYLKNIKDILKSNSDVFAFIGKPCDISAVKQLLKYDNELKDRVKIYLSFFCAGLPTFKAFDKIPERFSITREEISNVNFRGNGWPGKFKITTKNNKEYSLSYDDSWGKYLGKDLHFRCKICPDSVGKLADIVCGDAWVDEDDFSERPGRSLIFTRTDLGEEVVQQARKESYIHFFDYNIDKLKRIQRYQYTRQILLFSRLMGFKLIKGRYPKYKNMGYEKLILEAGIKNQFKNFFGSVKRNIKTIINIF